MFVVYLPGNLGSPLGLLRGPDANPSPVWPDPLALLHGGFAYLDLAPDGVSPGPISLPCGMVPGPPLDLFYGPLYRFLLSLGYTVLSLGWDWRLSLSTLGPRIWQQIRAVVGTSPFAVVAHSHGGLLARAIYQAMFQSGVQAQMAKLITIATPHYGTFESVKLWFHLQGLYAIAVQALGIYNWVMGQPGPSYVDYVFGSLPAYYELMPFAQEGPLFHDQPAQAAEIYTSGFYSAGNPFWSQALATNAMAVQESLTDVVPAGATWSFAGYDVQTAYQFAPGYPPTSNSGYLYTDVGDGVVTVAQASLVGAKVRTFADNHVDILTDGEVYAQIESILAS